MGTVNINEKNMMFGFNMGGKHEVLLNTLIFISSVRMKYLSIYKQNKFH
jgi:hypothetical protein